MSNKLLTRTRVFILALLLACLASVEGQAGQVVEKSGIKFSWSSGQQNLHEMAGKFERLYITLYNTGALPIRVIDDPVKTSQPLELIVRSEKLFFGDYFPLGLDSVLCDINPDICSRERKTESKRKLSSVTNHVGGYKKSPGIWRNNAKTKVNVPDLHFETEIFAKKVPYRQNDNVESLIAARDVRCPKSALSCVEFVKRWNKALFDKKRDPAHKPKIIRLPTVGYVTNYILTDIKHGKVKGVIEELKIKGGNIKQQTNRLYQASKEWRKFLENNARADINVDALPDNVESFGKASIEGYGDTHFDMQNQLFELINHPFSSMDAIQNYLKNPIPIAVFDFAFDKKHCEFANGVTIQTDLWPVGLPEPDRSVATECGDVMSNAPNKAVDHGTHVAGIIASTKNNKGVIGLNPFAKMTYVAIDSVNLQNPIYRRKVANRLFSLGLPLDPEDAIRVVNISWRYENSANIDSIETRIQNLSENTLFVVAAGNSNLIQKAGTACRDLRPACYQNYDNVIAVVGLDRSKDSPKLWRENEQVGSNSSSEFGIGAIASDVLSATYGNHTGRMSGTSQAAPQVSAAASLVYSRFQAQFAIAQPELLPIRVKNRLIYTSDIFNPLLTKVKGGRLNVGRALDMARDYLEVEIDGEIKVHKGEITKFGIFDPGKEYILCKLKDSSVKEISFKDLRRMFYDAPRRKYVVFFNKENGNRDSPVDRITDCKLLTRSNPAIFESDDTGGEVAFKFRDIRDFVSSMF